MATARMALQVTNVSKVYGTRVPMILQVPGVLPLGWVFVALAIALGIGVLSGLYPAIAAARMDPVDALKHEWAVGNCFRLCRRPFRGLGG